VRVINDDIDLYLVGHGRYLRNSRAAAMATRAAVAMTANVVVIGFTSVLF
jgi:hypothetical protein